jgi:formylglycine-generating enzyme required for sulfatase activity
VPVFTVSGIISTDNPGGPVSGAMVQLKQGAVNIGSPVLAGIDGTYTISGVTPGTYSIEAALSGYIVGVTPAFTVNGNITGKDLTLQRLFTISGTITIDDPSGPATGALVQLKQGVADIGLPVLAAIDGTYTILGVTPGTYSIEAALSGYAVGVTPAFTVSGNVTGKDLTLQRLPTISGTITIDDPSGPATGALVQLKQGAADIGSPVLAGIDGTYTISGVTPGTYSIEATLSGYFIGVTPAFLVSGNVTGKNLRLIKISADVQIRTISDVSVIFRYVPAGIFRRDGTAANISAITRGYWMGETEVSQELFQTVMGVNPSYFDGSSGGIGGSPARDTPVDEVQNRRPVEQVSWYAAIAFCNKLSLLDGKEPVYSVSGISDWAGLAYDAIPTSTDTTWDAVFMDTSKNGYRLPTEAEWMWAAMGADKTIQPNTTGYSKDFAGSTGSNSIYNYAWGGNSNEKTHEAGKKQANELGLYDMSGNVWEWCWDWYSDSGGTQIDYRGPASGTGRVHRGGCWNSTNASAYSVAYRDYYALPGFRNFDIGFRLAACP